MDLQEAYRKNLDIGWSCRMAKRMEQFRTNEKLGYRSAGSLAEKRTGDMLAEVMKDLGIPKVYKDAVTVDAWEFEKAVLTPVAEDPLTGRKEPGESIQLGAYQTEFVTDGPEQNTLVYVKKGTQQDYEGRDVSGKLVLVDINQRDEWWINFPVYQAHVKGAAAVIAVQTGGYGEVDESALNAQDIAGPPEAPAFSISGKDAAALKGMLDSRDEVEVLFDAVSRVEKNRTAQNIVGEIPGKNPNRRILLSAHYDSYFDGFQDDNTAVAMMLSMAKTFLEIGYEPENTLIFCCMAAEEWGVADSPFDWSAGAYEQVFTVHPEWRGTVIADLNFELPALAHGTRARIRSTFEYVPFLEEFLEELPRLTPAFPEETRVTAPIETWSDDFSIAISGIPSMVNDFTGGSFMETNYHSQFDNDSFYDEDVYRMHHELFGLLLFSLDQTAVVPLDFSGVFQKALECLDLSWCEKTGAVGQALADGLRKAAQTAAGLYGQVKEYNRRYRRSLQKAAGERKQESKSRDRDAALGGKNGGGADREPERLLLDIFLMEQDAFVRIDWHGNVLFPHTVLQEHLQLITGAAENLREGRLSAALRKLFAVDNNRYAFLFEEKVYRHFTEYVFDQPRERLKWGYGRIIGYENLYEVVKSLLTKEAAGDCDFTQERVFLEQAADRQAVLYREEIEKLRMCTERMERLLREAGDNFYGQ